MALRLFINPEYGLNVTYKFNNSVQKFYRGGEYINALWAQPQAEYNFDVAWFRQDQYDYLKEFSEVMRGGEYTFVFEDPLDYTVSNTEVQTNLGTSTQGVILERNGVFQLFKRYSIETGNYVYRPITKPNNITVYDETSTPRVEGVDFTIDYNYGYIAGGSVSTSWTWGGSFFVPVRFKNNNFPMSVETFDIDDSEQIFSIPGLVLQEIKEDHLYVVQNFGTDLVHYYQLPIEFGTNIDFTYEMDINKSQSGYEKRNFLNDRRNIKLFHKRISGNQKDYLITLWRNCLGNYSSIRWQDTETDENITVRFNGDISFTTLACDAANNLDLYDVDNIDLLQQSKIFKTAYCRLWSVEKAPLSFYGTDHDEKIIDASNGDNEHNPVHMFSGSSVPNTGELNTDNTDLTSVYIPESIGITQYQVETGQLNNASVKMYLYDWKNNSNLYTLFNGELGTYNFGFYGQAARQYNFECINNNQKLNTSDNVSTSLLCPYEFLSQSQNPEDRACNRSATGVTLQTSVTAGTNSSYIFTALGDTSAYNLGIMEVQSGVMSGLKFFISFASSNYLVLLEPTPDILQIGDLIQLTRSCNKTTTQCDGAFGNLTNFGGFPSLMGNDLALVPADQ